MGCVYPGPLKPKSQESLWVKRFKVFLIKPAVNWSPGQRTCPSHSWIFFFFLVRLSSWKKSERKAQNCEQIAEIRAALRSQRSLYFRINASIGQKKSHNVYIPSVQHMLFFFFKWLNLKTSTVSDLERSEEKNMYIQKDPIQLCRCVWCSLGSICIYRCFSLIIFDRI